MIDSLLEIVAPHHCYFCQKQGAAVCKSCIYNIVNEHSATCIECRRPSSVGSCNVCGLPFTKAWVVAERDGEMADLLHSFKWSRQHAAHKPLAQLLHRTLPILPSETKVVPIPTISRHVRIRGYDHAKLLADAFARQRGLSAEMILKRKNSAVQHTAANKTQRINQAAEAFYCNERLDGNVPYLIIDDIVTTGSTIKAATRVLKGAGAKEIWVAAVARQPLSK